MISKTTVVIGIAGGLGVLGTVLLVRSLGQTPITIKGAVLTRDADPRKELPIADAQVGVAGGLVVASGKSDAAGFFSIPLPRQIRRGQPLELRFQRAGYQTLELRVDAEDKLYIARLAPVISLASAQPSRPEVKISNVVARYSVNTTTAVNVGSAVRTFEVVNTGNVPCQGQGPCSPDGKWKAAVLTESMDAGPGDEFRNARASCIAGPCPFTRIEESNFSQNSRTIHVTVRNWSDTTTFLLEAEVFHPTANAVLRRSYPVIFGRDLSFTLPATAEGVSIEADVNGEMIVFPLGPDLRLSWATCQLLINKDQTRVYQCELKPEYRFP